jgi:hypothetical protein
MAYSSGGLVQATDYNNFFPAGINLDELYSDTHSNAVTVAQSADFGYGNASPIDVTTGQFVTAAQWTAIFNIIKNIGIHQGVATSQLPTLPLVTGTPILAYPAINTLLTTLRDPANRFTLISAQSAFSTAVSGTGSVNWITSLQYKFTFNFGTWNQLRYFFNMGGSIGCVASYPTGPAGSDDEMWSTLLSQVSTIHMRAKDTFSSGGSKFNTISMGGLWHISGSVLPTSLQEVYRAFVSAGVYGASQVSLRARLLGVPPAAGSERIEMELMLTQQDSTGPFDAKYGTTTVTMHETHSAGAMPYLSGSGGPGPVAVTITPGAFTLSPAPP